MDSDRVIHQEEEGSVEVLPAQHSRLGVSLLTALGQCDVTDYPAPDPLNRPYSFGGTSPHTRPSATLGSSSSTSTPSASGQPSQQPAATGAAGAHTHAGPHHHHHHHHVPHRSGYMQEPPRTSTPASQSTATPSGTGAKDPARPESSASTFRPTTGFNGLSRPPAPPSEDQAMQQILRERQKRMQVEREERERNLEAYRREEREAREARAKQATSPRISTASNPPTSANPYPRPSLPPSPTNSRNLGVPTSASPVSSTKPSPSLPPTNAPATGSTQRPNLPLPSIGAIGGARSLPSPFDPQAGRPQSAAAQPGHHRSGSGTSTSGGIGGRPADVPGSATAKVDPTRPGAPPAMRQPQTQQPPPSSTAALHPASGGINRPINRQPLPAHAAGRHPTPHNYGPGGQDPDRTGASTGSAATSTKPTTAAGDDPANRPPPGRDYYGGNYPFSGGGNFMPFSGGFDYNSFSGWSSRRPMTDRERIAKEQRELQEDRRKLAVEQEARVAREKAEANAKREEELRKYRLEREAEEARIKAEDRERSRSKMYDTFVPGPRVPTGSTSTSTSTNAPAPAPPLASGATNTNTNSTDTALQQVAPQREPRPYEYKTDSRDYQYTPRDKRPRMDAAVDDARRGNANKSRRRKDDDRGKSPVKARDLSHLTEATKKYPDVHSTAVEKWLKTVGELNRIVANETYTGNSYRMSQHRSRHVPGGIVQVRIGGGFLGRGWKLRGEVGWDEAVSDPTYTDVKPEDGTDEGRGGEDYEICAAWKERGIWGTDVYTDDSDLGLVLVHAGWLKWGGQGPLGTDTDSVIVDVRIVPPLARYFATERNGIRTRGWGNGHDGGSIVIEAVRRLPVGSSKLVPRSIMLEISLLTDS